MDLIKKQKIISKYVDVMMLKRDYVLANGSNSNEKIKSSKDTMIYVKENSIPYVIHIIESGADNKVKLAFIYLQMEGIKHYGSTNVILIGKTDKILAEYENALNTKITKGTDTMINKIYKMYWSQFTHDITKQLLVPEHIILSTDKKSEIIQQQGKNINQFVKILDDDPICVYIGAKAGDIIQINRKDVDPLNSRPNKFAIEYRYVIKPDSAVYTHTRESYLEYTSVQ